MISSWPVEGKSYQKEHDEMETIIAIIKAIRNARAEKGVPDNKKIDGQISATQNEALYISSKEYIKKLALLQNLDFVSESKFAQESVKLIFNDCKIALPLESLVNFAEEKARIEKEIEKVKFEIARSEKMLANEGFVAKAPQALIDKEREKLAKNKQLFAKLEQDEKKYV